MPIRYRYCSEVNRKCISFSTHGRDREKRADTTHCRASGNSWKRSVTPMVGRCGRSGLGFKMVIFSKTSTAPTTRDSKFISLALRHKPDIIGLRLDTNGWASIAELSAKAKAAGVALSEALIRRIAAESDKQRLLISEDGLRIRANQPWPFRASGTGDACIPSAGSAVPRHGRTGTELHRLQRYTAGQSSVCAPLF